MCLTKQISHNTDYARVQKTISNVLGNKKLLRVLSLHDKLVIFLIVTSILQFTI